jgi:hypothetical protein
VGKAFHLVHPHPLSVREFAALFPAPPPLVPLETWLALLNEKIARDEDPSAHLIWTLAQGLDRADLTPPRFDCSATTASLHGTGISCLPLDQQFAVNPFID